MNLFSCQCRDQKKIYIITAVLVRHQHSIFLFYFMTIKITSLQKQYTANKNPEGTWSIIASKRMKASEKQLKWIIFVSEPVYLLLQ